MRTRDAGVQMYFKSVTVRKKGARKAYETIEQVVPLLPSLLTAAVQNFLDERNDTLYLLFVRVWKPLAST